VTPTVTRRDVALAVVLLAVVLAQVAFADDVPAGGRVASVVAATAILGLAVRRRAPLAVLVVLVGAVVAQVPLDGVLTTGAGATLLAVVVACFALGAHAAAPWRAAVGGAVAAAGMTLGNQLGAGDEYPVLDDLAFFAILCGAPLLVGHALGRRAELVARLDERTRALRAAREEQSAAALAEERALLAIALNEALAHRVGEMSLQAAGAERLAAGDPARAREALAAIERTARAALDDIREVIGVLRREEPTGEPPPAPAGATATAGAPAAPAGATATAGEPPPAPAGATATAAARGAAAPAPAERPRAPWRLPAGAWAHVAVAALAWVAFTVDAFASGRMEGPAALNVLGLAAVAAPLAFLRRAPLPAAAATMAAALAQSLLLTPLAHLVAPLVLLLLPAYAVAAHLPLRGALAGAAVCLAGTLAIEPSAITALLGAAAWAGGRAVRDRARKAERLDALVGELEATAGAHDARVRGEERLRVARELHDAVAHSMTVIVLQAGAAQRVWEADPAAARAAVTALAGVARDTLGELRATLRALGHDGGPPAGLGALPALVERVRPLGLDVRLRDEGEPAPLAPQLDHVAFRVVQEALTNAARHAAPTTVDVRLRRLPAELRIEVVDAGRDHDRVAAPAVPGSGRGLHGMAERVAAHRGQLDYGPNGQGFAVRARLPLEPAA